MLIKSFGKNIVIYEIKNIYLRGIVFMLLLIYTHALSVRDYSLLSTLVIIKFMPILMNLGMRVALVRFTETTYHLGENVSCSKLLICSEQGEKNGEQKNFYASILTNDPSLSPDLTIV